MSEGDVSAPDLASELLKVTREMLLAARARDWQAVAACEAERHYINARLFGEPIPQAQRTAVAEVVRQVLACDPELKRLTEAARTQLAGEAQVAKAKRRAVQAYHTYSRD